MKPDTCFLITETQVNEILGHLAECPYSEVFELVATLQRGLPKIETAEAEKIETEQAEDAALISTTPIPVAHPSEPVRANGIGFIHPVELNVTPAFNPSNPFNQ